MGEHASLFDPEFLKHAAAAVFHYFRDELDRESVTVAEFSLALEKVLRGFDLEEVGAGPDNPTPRVVQSDLCQLVKDSPGEGELFFFPRLRDELRAQLRLGPQLVCFQGLRACVKQLAGARRWNNRCQGLHDQIVEFLRSCMTQETQEKHCGSCAVIVK